MCVKKLTVQNVLCQCWGFLLEIQGNCGKCWIGFWLKSGFSHLLVNCHVLTPHSLLLTVVLLLLLVFCTAQNYWTCVYETKWVFVQEASFVQLLRECKFICGISSEFPRNLIRMQHLTMALLHHSFLCHCHCVPFFLSTIKRKKLKPNQMCCPSHFRALWSNHRDFYFFMI